MPKLEAQLGDNDWLLGDKISLVDFFWGNLYSQWFARPDIYDKEKFDALAEQHPKFKAYGERFIAANKSYLDTRPKVPL